MWFKRKPRAQWAEAPEPEVAVPAPRAKLSWFEKRDRRRRRRKLFEEILGWILVPAMLYLIYLAIKSVGGVPKEIVDFGREIIGIATKGGR